MFQGSSLEKNLDVPYWAVHDVFLGLSKNVSLENDGAKLAFVWFDFRGRQTWLVDSYLCSA